MHKHNNCGCSPAATTLWDKSWFDNGIRAIRETTYKAVQNAWHACRHYGPCTPPYRDTPPEAGRQWHVDLQNRFKLHPVVLTMLEHKPDHWPTLLLEWPHVSEKDSRQLAYTRDEAKGEANVQTLTSIGKYVARHWPHVSDHIRRDACALFTPDSIEFVEASVDAFVRACLDGPKSCMNTNRFEVHPYEVYDPKYGWGMVVRRSGAQINGRALTWTNPDDDTDKVYARTYKRHENHPDGYSESDTVLESWLQSQGFRRASWPYGAKLAFIRNSSDDVVLPYIDGSNDRVRLVGTFRGPGAYLEVCYSDESDYIGENQNGLAEATEDDEPETIGECECCGATVYEDDDRIWAGRNEGELICGSCEHYFTHVTGAARYGRTTEYYVHNDNAVQVNDEWYDTENLPGFIVELADGGYAHQDDVVTIDNEYYLCDDESVVCLAEPHPETDDSYALKDDCWKCAHTGEYWPDCVEYEESDGETYHPDALAEMRAEQQVAAPV